MSVTAAHLEAVEDVKRDAHALARSLAAAEAAGVDQGLLLPELIQVMREHGLLPESFSFADLLGGLKFWRR